MTQEDAVEHWKKGAEAALKMAHHPYLAGLLHQSFDAANQELFRGLNKFAVAARYSDPFWAKDFATEEQARLWLEQTSVLLPVMLDAS